MSETVNQIVPLAEKAFAEHEITHRIETYQGGNSLRWYSVRRQGTGVYGFEVTLTPGWIHTTGDVGHLSLSRELDMVPWCRGTIGKAGDPRNISWGYVAEKAANEIVTQKWSEWAAAKALDSYLCDDDCEISWEDRCELYELARSGEEAWGEVHGKLYEITGDHCESQPTDWAPSFVWNVMAIRCFLRLLDKEAK